MLHSSCRMFVRECSPCRQPATFCSASGCTVAVAAEVTQCEWFCYWRVQSVQGTGCTQALDNTTETAYC